MLFKILYGFVEISLDLRNCIILILDNAALSNRQYLIIPANEDDLPILFAHSE